MNGDDRVGFVARQSGAFGKPLLAIAGALLMLTGCANFTPDGGMGRVQTAATSALGKDVARIRSDAEAAEAEARVRGLIASSLTADKAVQVALLNNRGLQASFAELAASEAESVEAGLPPSPTLSLTRLTASIASGPAYGSALEVERQLLVNVLSLLTLPRRRDIAEHRFKQAQLRTIESVLKTATSARRAYYRAIASAQTVTFLEEARVAAESASEVAKRLGETGALNKIDQAREHAFYAELGAQLAAARLKRDADRERLVRVLGLWGKDAHLRLATRLPSLPARVKALPDIEAEAIDKRIDLAIARMELDILAKSYGLTRGTRFINVLEVAGMSNFEKERVVTPQPPPDDPEIERTKTRWRGLELEIQIPIWDLGAARTRKAEETYIQAVHRLAERAINVRSEVREAYSGYRGSYDIARHYQKEILPLRKIISEETMLRYNAMIADLSALLVDARARIMSNIAAIDAQRDYFLAATDLQAAIIGGGMDGGATEGPRVAAAGGGEGAGH
jgi:outer membrane protein TolC